MTERSTPGETSAGAVVETGARAEPQAASPRAPKPASKTVRNAARRSPLSGREVLSIVLLVVLADVTLYRGHGFAGLAAFFAAAPLLLLLGAPQGRFHRAGWIVGAMLALLAAKFVWSGFAALVVAGGALLAAFATTLAGRSPYVLDVLIFAVQSVVAGFFGLPRMDRSPDQLSPQVSAAAWLKVVLPLVTVLVFGTLFVLANPDLAAAVADHLTRLGDRLWEAAVQWTPAWDEALLWLAVGWLAVGLLRPVIHKSVLAHLSGDRRDASVAEATVETPFYAAFRNTLLAVIGLFAVYLVFEFKTLWFRDFPEGFYYAGYAHEGAAWLTAALALATVVLSVIFRASVFRDPRLPRLRRLAWIWSFENVLLALAVYNRLFIYIGFNGMTRMRTVGLFGITAVLVGFILVVWKITHGRDFVWLLRRHLWTLAVALYLLAVIPVDAIVHTYNVRRILAGDPAPSVQISVHPINSAGILVLPPLLDSEDPIIREGVRALLAERAAQLKRVLKKREEQGWTSFQGADRVLFQRLRNLRTEWEKYGDSAHRDATLQRFHDYAYQWY